MPNEYDVQRLRNDTFVEQVDLLDEVDSTNSYAARKLVAEFTGSTPWLVLAQRQTSGRGRGTNQWWAGDGSLAFSLIVDAQDVPPASLPIASLTAGLAMCRAIEQMAPAADVALKWPNDVYLFERKVCGILMELPPVQPARLIIGVGVNVNNSLGDGPAEIQRTATSLVDRLELEFDRTEVLVHALQQLERHLDSLRTGADSLVDQWQAYCLLSGRTVEIDAAGQRIHGRCLGIEADGALLVRTPQEDKRLFGGTVVSFY
ncbi:MAG: biotin--[acetyl-CoA-carboxylase] ligase [Planctomycetales bacterium]|nr:biotin--[acetyl-CoA-carboxylase] ligase [Planctomycetales bacterium]